jgi:flagellar biosynthesis regulator FlaF
MKKKRREALLNRIFITPQKNKYSLIKYEKINNKYFYTYCWINCPDDIKKLTTNKIIVELEPSINDIDNWINDIKDNFEKFSNG